MKTLHSYQDGALLVSASTSYFSNSLYTPPWKGGVGNVVSDFVQATEHKLSQWFWEGIASLPKDYFSKDITNVNYSDKSLWEGIFNDRIAVLQVQLTSALTKQQSDGLQDVKDGGLARVDKLREQMAAGLSQGKPALEEQLIELQGLVGKHTLSPPGL